MSESSDSSSEPPDADFLTDSDDDRIDDTEALIMHYNKKDKSRQVKSSHRAYARMARDDRRARGLPDDSDSVEEDDDFDAEMWLDAQEIKNEYELSEKGRMVLKNQCRGFFGFNMDGRFRAQLEARKVSPVQWVP